jgi:hypothetical protein
MGTSFGQTIPVTGPNIGFPGSVSRFGERVITARQFNPFTATNNLNFGDPTVLIPGAAGTGGTYDSVADFVAHAVSNIGLLATYWSGVAVREVQSQITYPAGQTPGILQVGYYANQQMAEVLQRGSVTVQLAVGAPSAEDQIYTRVVLNSAVSAGVVGDYETNPAATDLFTDVTPTGTVNTTSLTITNSNIKVGQLVSGPGIAAGTYVTAYTAGTATLSKALQQAVLAGMPVTFSNLFALTGVVARTGHLDSNNMLEITLERRYSA